MYNTKAYSATSATSPLASTTIARRDPTEQDVQIDILYCGICHTDIHQVRNEWKTRCPPSTHVFRGTKSTMQPTAARSPRLNLGDSGADLGHAADVKTTTWAPSA